MASLQHRLECNVQSVTQFANTLVIEPIMSCRKIVLTGEYNYSD